MDSLKTKTPRTFVPDEIIIELHRSGWSISDIVAHHKTSVRRVRKVLQEQGIDTSKQRSASKDLKECFLQLVSCGVTVREIAAATDSSAHLIRQVLRDNQVNVTALRGGDASAPRFSLQTKEWRVFLELYLSGNYGFLKCAEMRGFSISDCVEAVLRLSQDDVSLHQNRIRAHIIAQKETGLSVSSVAKRFGVSASLVKEVFNSANVL